MFLFILLKKYFNNEGNHSIHFQPLVSFCQTTSLKLVINSVLLYNLNICNVWKDPIFRPKNIFCHGLSSFHTRNLLFNINDCFLICYFTIYFGTHYNVSLWLQSKDQQHAKCCPLFQEWKRIATDNVIRTER